jgi:hypothetical protein
LIHCEQGFGDTLHFARYAWLVRKQSGAQRVIMETQAALARLLSQSGGCDVEVVAGPNSEAGALGRFDWHVPLLSLPLALRIYDPQPMIAAYIRADPGLRRQWRERVVPGASIRVGLAWAGSPTKKADCLRSISPDIFLPLFEIPGIELYSLQVAPRAGEAQRLTKAGLVDLTEHLRDFADTAAFVAELDLIISVDTAVAHLAGAMAVPVWTLLPFQGEWRWGRAAETTAWYPTMRLFRQSALGDWETVIRRVADALCSFSRVADIEKT